MSQFIQLHALVSYPPSNLNRDDLGRPKTAIMGGVQRLRVSSQSLKRAWRTSTLFADLIGVRTKMLGVEVEKTLKAKGISDKNARDWAAQIAAVYGAVKKDKAPEIEQLVHISPAERATLDALVDTLAAEKRAPETAELDALLHEQHAVDIAMFGRMLASKTQHNVEAAVQVAHALGVHASVVEDDFFTAVDDLNQDDSGAAHLGETGFAAAVFYQYVCIDRSLLKRNLGGDEALTQRAIQALIETALTVPPNGKQNSFASRAYAHYAVLERGDRQPRSLSLAFLKPVAKDYTTDAVQALENLYTNMDTVYGPCAEARTKLNVLSGEGSLAALLAFAAE